MGRKPYTAGLTLLEIIFASFIFSGLVTVLGSIWVMHARAQAQTGQLLVAGDLADLEMSQALAMGYHSVAPSTGSYTQVWEAYGQQVEHVFGSEVQVIQLENSSGTPIPMKLVRVTVTYPQGEHQKSFSIDSVIADET